VKAPRRTSELESLTALLGQLNQNDPDTNRPPVPEKGPRPEKGPESLAAFIDHLSNNDSAFDVIVGEGRILTTKAPLAVQGKPPALVAVGDPSVLDFAVINARQIRVVGLRIGVTDLSITAADNQTYNLEVRVLADLDPLRAKLAALFPDACLKLVQIRDHVAVEGQARDSVQVKRIIDTIGAYLTSVLVSQNRKVTPQGLSGPSTPPQFKEPLPPPKDGESLPAVAGALERPSQKVEASVAVPQIINLIRVPGSQQVLLKVRVAELNRTALRQIGTDFLVFGSDAKIGSQIGGSTVNATASGAAGLLQGIAQTTTGSTTTLFAIFDKADFALFFSALRRNSLLKILAEPNLVALNGMQASFLAGGEFPVPVPQTGGGGIAPTITILFKQFGVQLAFTPTILDGDVIRLVVDPEVSTIDPTLSTTLVPGGSPVPGLNTRKAHTVVELKEGQTLAIAGLMQVSIAAQTDRIPLLGDLPVLGPFFSNTTNTRQEKELIVLVTPYRIEPMAEGQVPPLPGSEVGEPTDLEFYIGNHIEGRTGQDFRSTVSYDLQSPLLRALFRLDSQHVRGPFGYSD
jgi:pilus assembly protein CpaC